MKVKGIYKGYDREIYMSQYITIPKEKYRRMVISEVLGWGIAGFLVLIMLVNQEIAMKRYKLKIQETIEYDCEIDAGSVKDAELKALQHPEKWQEIQGVLDVLDVEQAD